MKGFGCQKYCFTVDDIPTKEEIRMSVMSVISAAFSLIWLGLQVTCCILAIRYFLKNTDKKE